jgi:sugar lactone lactonase YvrE
VSCLLWLVLAQAQDITYDSMTRYVKTKVVGVPDGDHVNGAFSSARLWQPQGGMLIKDSNIMILADTENQVIRRVDWGAQTVNDIVGNATVQGNCLDESCPPNSFTDGTGVAATFTMPYGVQLHHEQKYALVADTRSNAIRKLNLYTNTILTVIRNVGYPTDVVSHGNSIWFCDGQNHSIWKYNNLNAGLMDQTSGEWPTGDLQFLSGANHPQTGQYAEGVGGVGGLARFWEPLGVTYDTTRDVLYVADFRNRVIRQLDPTTGDTVRKVGQQTQPANIKDAADALLSELSGPTNLRYFAGGCVFPHFFRAPAHGGR